MLNLPKHGQPVIFDHVESEYSGLRTAKAACGFFQGEKYPNWDQKKLGGFGYFQSPDNGTWSKPKLMESIALVADAMIEQNGTLNENNRIPAAYTYFGQFVDHDITANTDRENGFSNIDTPDLQPLDPVTVVEGLANLRSGKLDLDSLYGGAMLQGGFAQKIHDEKLLRHPVKKAMLRLGTTTATGSQDVVPPADRGGDILRLGRLLRSGSVSQDDLDAMPIDLKGQFFEEVEENGQITRQAKPVTAIIGDSRNDENLAVAQLHLAMARLHNTTVIHGHTIGGPKSLTSQKSYEFAQQQTRWQYQWLIINDYLPRICDRQVLQNVLETGAPLYDEFRTAHQNFSSGALPLPLEFSVAAFRFGHTMARAAYDWNEFFGDGPAPNLPNAPFSFLFSLTGGATPPMSLKFGTNSPPPTFPTLPANWKADWSRLTEENTDKQMRHARPIDTQISPFLTNMENEPSGASARMKHLAERNLRRGVRLNLPSAQDLISSFGAKSVAITALTGSELENGPGGNHLKDGELVSATPLWYYVLREAEVQNGGAHLGELGSRIVAETLCGLVLNDPNSYWHQPGSDADMRWSPEDNIKPRGEAMTTLAKVFQAVGVMS